MSVLKLNWFYPVILVVFVILNLTACGGNSSDPHTTESDDGTYPKSSDDSYVTEEDTFLNIPVEDGVLSNDTPYGENTIFLDTVGEMETQNGGTINLAEDGSFTYEPPADFSGNDQAAYTINNSEGKYSESFIFIEVTPVNDPPNPQDDQAETPIDQPVAIDVLANDIEPDGDTITIQNVGSPDSGSVAINADDTITYTPQTGHSGAVSFYYITSDENGEVGQAWVYIDIGNSGLNDDSISIGEDQLTTFPVSDLLANDENGDQLTVISIGEAGNGMAELIGDTITYTPNVDYSGPDRFTYTVQAVSGITASAVVNVIVTPVPDPPVITDIEDQQINQGGNTGALMFTIEDPDTDLSDLDVTAEVTDANPVNLIPDGGIVLFCGGILPTGTIRVIPDQTLFGTATITVTVSDPEGHKTSDSFVLTVN